MTRIAILCVGSHGDVQPYIALGMGLREAGYDVCIVTHKIFGEWVLKEGLGFSPIRSNPIDMLKTQHVQSAVKSGINQLRSRLHLARAVKPFILETGVDCWTGCKDADAIMYSTLGFYFAPHIAEKLNVPAIPAHLQPFIYATRAFPSLLFNRNLGSVLNRLTWRISELLYWLPFRSLINQWRNDHLELPTIPLTLNYPRWVRTQNHPKIFGISPTVMPKPPDWADNIRVTGYWFLNDSSDWQPAADLVDFLSTGTPPVYIGFGSFIIEDSERITEIVLRALALTGQRGLISKGWGGLSRSALTYDLFEVDAVPHDWLFPQMAAVVHHGGAGTAAAGLRAGVPSIVVPFYLDNHFWGRRVADLGVGPTPIPFSKISVERLAAAINRAIGDKEMQKRANDIGERIRAEDGVGTAVDVINRYLSCESSG